MMEYIARRLALALLIVLGATVITFFLTRVIPSDPAMLWVGRFASAEQIERAREQLGLDAPWYVQYVRYVGRLLHGDLGLSLRTHKPVASELATRLPASAELILIGMTFGLFTGVSLGCLSAARPNSAFDQIARFFSVGGVALPQFWFAMILQLTFGVVLGLLPLAGRMDMRLAFANPISTRTGFFLLDALISGNWVALKDSALHLILPALTLAAYPIGMSARLTRAKMIEVLNEDYIRTARSFGIRESRLFLRHALRNALGPVVTLTAISLVYTFVGTFLIESIFAWPGIGSYTAQAILSNDVSVILGVTLLVAILTVVLNLAADLILAFLDPRIRLE
ncbi:ABC transporter permease [Candidatus Bipolaricaulota bacterium]